MSSPGAGFVFPATPVTWLKRDALLFAASIGCAEDDLHFVYELHPSFAVFPTYPIILPFKKDSQEVVDYYAAERALAIPGVPNFDATRVVDGQRRMIFYRLLPPSSAGRDFVLNTKVLGVYDKGRPGSVVETQTDLVDRADGTVYCSAISSVFYVGQGNWGGPKGPSAPSFPPPSVANGTTGRQCRKTADLTFLDVTSSRTPLLYRLNGDYNPLHVTPEPGRKMGFGGVIMHGLYSFNATCHLLLKHLGASDPANLREYQVRFASPVRPGDRLVTSVWRTGDVDADGFEDIRFETAVDGGKVCLSNGRAFLKVVELKSRL